MNFGNIFSDAARLRPDAIALIQADGDGRRLTYGELDARANQVAHGLVALGLEPGDRVAVLVKNDIRFAECMFGAMRAGAVVTPVTTRARYDTLAHILADSGARVLIASAHFAEEAARLKDAAPDLGHVFVMDQGGDSGEYESWRGSAPAAPLDVPLAEDAVCLLAYTSGSTGVPKGVLLTHHGHVWWSRMVRRGLQLGPEHRCLVAVPVFHMNGMLVGLAPTLECGGSVVMLGDFDARGVIDALARHACTHTTGVPAMYKLMLRESDLVAASDFSKLEFVVCSSSEVPEELMTAFEERTGAPMIECYGLTEGGAMVLGNPRWGLRKRGTAGVPPPGIEVRIVDPDNLERAVAPGAIGELMVKSPNFCKGYHNLPEVTAERFLAGGWLRTRDLARADDQGYVKIIGRQDDMIICGGENIYPKEVEDVLMTHPNVADVAVVAIPDDMKGEVPVAFVVEKKKGTTSAEEIKRYFLDKGAAYAHPRKVFVIDELPLTGAKKIDRTTLKERARA